MINLGIYLKKYLYYIILLLNLNLNFLLNLINWFLKFLNFKYIIIIY